MAVNPTGGEPTREEEARIARVYRLASTEEPPSHVDAAIAAAARWPVEPALQRRAPPWWHMWRLPFGLAAVAVISVSLVTLMRDEGGERLTSVPPAAPPAKLELDRQVSEALTASVETQAPERRARVAEPARSRPDPAEADPQAAMGARALEAERVAAPAPRPSPAVAAHIIQLEGRAPALWVERIVTLRRDGRRAEADGLLAEFRRRFPEETLPASLQ